jgi:hypothetical protein
MMEKFGGLVVRSDHVVVPPFGFQILGVFVDPLSAIMSFSLKTLRSHVVIGPVIAVAPPAAVNSTRLPFES